MHIDISICTYSLRNTTSGTASGMTMSLVWLHPLPATKEAKRIRFLKSSSNHAPLSEISYGLILHWEAQADLLWMCTEQKQGKQKAMAHRVGSKNGTELHCTGINGKYIKGKKWCWARWVTEDTHLKEQALNRGRAWRKILWKGKELSYHHSGCACIFPFERICKVSFTLWASSLLCTQVSLCNSRNESTRPCRSMDFKHREKIRRRRKDSEILCNDSMSYFSPIFLVLQCVNTSSWTQVLYS